MNMAIRGIDADIKYGDTLHNDQLKDLKAYAEELLIPCRQVASV